MKHRLLLHSLSHRIVVVEITAFGLSDEPRTATVPAMRFPNLTEAEQFLRAKGADADVVRGTFAALQKQSVAVLTVAT